MEQTIQYNPEEALNEQVSNWWKTSPTVNKVKKTIKKEASDRPLWKVGGIILIVAFLAFGKNMLKYGVKPVLMFPLSIFIYPFMEGWVASKRK